MNNATVKNYEVTDFATQVLERSKEVPVLADFWAPWCAPCRSLGPVLERLAEQANGRWELAKVNTEEHQEQAATFNISSIPAVKLFVNGEVVNAFVGALPEREIRRFLDQSLPSPNSGYLTEAQRLLNEGANDAAAKLLEPILENEPGNEEVRVLLAQAVLNSTPERVSPLLQPIGPDSELADKASALRVLGGLAVTNKQPQTLPDANFRDRYLQGASAVASGDFASALEAFIDVLDRDKQYAEGGAKEACKAIFRLLGPRHPLSDRYFRAFSSRLHS
jgi:putative thioredoxin